MDVSGVSWDSDDSDEQNSIHHFGSGEIFLNKSVLRNACIWQKRSAGLEPAWGNSAISSSMLKPSLPGYPA